MTRFHLNGQIVWRGLLVTLLVGGFVSVLPLAQTSQTRDTYESTQALRAAQEQVEVLRDLVREVRAMREVVERYTNRQVQMQAEQATNGLLEIQERRVAEATVRLDNARREHDGVSAEIRRLKDELTAVEDRLQGVAGGVDAKQRAALADEQRGTKVRIEQLTDIERQMWSRESEASSALGLEQAKWNELVERLTRPQGR